MQIRPTCVSLVSARSVAGLHQIEEIEAEGTERGSFRDNFRNGQQRFGNRAFIAIATQCSRCVDIMSSRSTSQLYPNGFWGWRGRWRCSCRLFSFLGIPLPPCPTPCLTGLISAQGVLTSPFGALSVEKAGRRKLLILSFAGMGIYMAVIGGCISQTNSHIAVHAAMAFMILYVFFLDSHTCTAQRSLHTRPHANHGDVDGIVVDV